MVKWDWDFRLAARRSPTFAANVVSTSQPLAAQAGVAAYQRGGNAVDAALSAAITLTVVEPVMNGLGSDAMALVATSEGMVALNGSGRSPRGWHPGYFSGRSSMPTEGWDSVTVPGAVASWWELSHRFGRLPFADLFSAALRYASEGFPVTPVIARQWANQIPRLKDQPGFAEAFLPQGRVPAVGERFRLPGQSEALEQLAETRGRSLYEGSLADRLVEHARRNGGVLGHEDLSGHRSEWVESMALDYRSLTVHELPPNTQGMVVLVTLGILRHFDVGSLPWRSAQRIHLQVEAMKQAFRLARAVVGDPGGVEGPGRSPDEQREAWLDPDFLQAMAGRIPLDRASDFNRPWDVSGGTVYVAAADASGMVVSFIQSNFQGFGSGVVVPGTGVSLHNRAAGFSLSAGHPNEVAGGKRPLHTILPALLARGGRVVGALGVVGANMQPQGQVQILSAMEDFGFNPQVAVDAPRWRLYEDGSLKLEHGFDPALAQELVERGHRVELRPEGDPEFGGAQLVMGLESADWVAISDGRRDGMACGY